MGLKNVEVVRGEQKYSLHGLFHDKFKLRVRVVRHDQRQTAGIEGTEGWALLIEVQDAGGVWKLVLPPEGQRAQDYQTEGPEYWMLSDGGNGLSVLCPINNPRERERPSASWSWELWDKLEEELALAFEFDPTKRKYAWLEPKEVTDVGLRLLADAIPQRPPEETA